MQTRTSSLSCRVRARQTLSGGLLSIAALLWTIAAAEAEPTNGTIVAGGGVGASIGSVANVGGGFDVTIQQNSDKMVIEWDDFNIDANDLVDFNQPSSSAIAVNKVIGGLLTPTTINGTLASSGHVWILDPAGVAFGAGAVVDVGGLLATTSALDTAAFMATDPATGTFTFTEDGTGSITNAADLEAQGLIALVAPMVTNSASLTSDNGDVLLGGAKAFRLSFAEVDRTPAGGGAVYQELLVTDFIIDTGVDNAVAPAETIPVTQTAAGSASGSNIILSAASTGGGAFLNVDGVVEATNVGTSSGAVMLLGGADLVSGAVAATGTETVRTADLGVDAAGALTVQASSVSIAASAQDITVGSASIVAVTGDAAVNDAIVATGAIDITATAGSVAAGALNASAIDITANSGNIDVGATTGGSTITMSAQDIDLAGKVDATTTAMLTATTGDVSSTGALEIEGSAVTVSGPVLGGTSATITATSSDATLDAVTATTGAINITANSGNIDVGAATAGSTITMAAQDIDLAGKVDATTTAMLTATTGDVSSTGALEIEGSAVTVSGPILAATNATITATSADATLDAVTATTGAIAITANSGNIDVGATTAGSTITMSAQDIDLAGKVDATTTAMLTATTGNVSSTGALEIEGSAVTVSGPVQGGTSATITATSSDATLDAVTATTGAIAINAASGNIDVGATTAGSTITMSAQDIDLAGKVDATTTAMLTATTGDVSSTGALEIEGSAVTVSGPVLGGTSATITATSGNATLDAVTATTGSIGITANSGNIDVGATTAGTTITMFAQDIDLAGKVDATTTAMLTATTGNVSSTGALEIEGSAVTVSGPVLGGTSATITATSGNATLDAVTATTGAIAINAASGNIDVGATTAGSTITMAAQDIDLAGKVDATTTAMLTATTGDVSSTGALEIEGSAVTVSGPIRAATNATITATSGNATLDAVTATTGAIGITANSGNIDVGATTAGTTITMAAQDIDLAGKVDATTTAMLTATTGDVSSAGALEIEGSAVTVSGPVLGGTSATITATSGNATLDAVTATTGAIAINAASGNIDVGATTAGTTITMSAQDIDLAGKVDATTTAMLTATTGDVSSTGALEIEGSAVTVSGPVLGGTSATITATSSDATLDAVTATTGAINITANSGNIDVGATTAGTSITMSAQDIDLAGKVNATTSAMLTATTGDVSSTGILEIEAGSISLIGAVKAATDIVLTALTGGISSTGSLTATLGDIVANAPNGPISVNDLVAAGDISLIGGSVSVTGTGTAHGSAFLQAVTGNVSVTGAVDAIGGTLVLDASNGSALLNRIGALTDVTLTVSDLDLSGSISAGDQFILETDRTGQTIVLGGDGTTGDVTLRRTAGLIIDESELTKISAGRFDIDGGANDVLLLDARLTTSSLDTMMIGTDQSSRIIAAGTVTGLTSLQLGYQTTSLDRRPELILISGQLGLDTSTGRLGTVRLESADDIVIGTERFLEVFESEALSLLGLASLPLSVVGGIDDHVFVATEQLQIEAPGSVVQLNTGRGVEGAGLVFNVPSTGDGVLFPSGTGPEEVLIFGEVIRSDGTRVSAFNASLEPNILFGGGTTSAEPALTQNDQYYMNFCLIGDPVSCSADSLREIERNNRFINGDPSGLGGVIPVVFETGENDERDQEEDLGGVAASGNEALWDAGSR